MLLALLGLGAAWLMDQTRGLEYSNQLHREAKEKERILKELDHWGRIKFILEKTQRESHMINKYQPFHIYWDELKRENMVYISMFDAETSEAWWKSGLPMMDFLIEYFIKPFKKQGEGVQIDRLKPNTHWTTFSLFDKNGNSTYVYIWKNDCRRYDWDYDFDIAIGNGKKHNIKIYK